MAYSHSPSTLQKILPQLEPLMKGQECLWTLDAGADSRAAEKWAYKVREALSIALRHPGRFPELALIAPMVKIEVVSDVAVSATFSVQVVSVSTTVSRGNTAQGPDGKGFSGASSAMQIIEHWLGVQASTPSNSPMQFTQMHLGPAELLKLYNWAMKRQPRPWMVIAPEGSSSITLMPWDDRAAEAGANWTPAGETEDASE